MGREGVNREAAQGQSGPRPKRRGSRLRTHGRRSTAPPQIGENLSASGSLAFTSSINWKKRNRHLRAHTDPRHPADDENGHAGKGQRDFAGKCEGSPHRSSGWCSHVCQPQSAAWRLIQPHASAGGQPPREELALRAVGAPVAESRHDLDVRSPGGLRRRHDRRQTSRQVARAERHDPPNQACHHPSSPGAGRRHGMNIGTRLR